MDEIFIYGDREVAHLKKVDPALGAIIDQIGHIERAVIPDLFTALVNSIVAQQISSKAKDTVWKRMMERFGKITPETVCAASAEDIQQCGMSMRRVNYIKEAASSVLSGELDIEALHTMPDDEVCRRLSGLPGIGVWTAEMLMTFSMQRPDILSWGDLAIHRGMRMLYRHRKIDRELFQKYRQRYSPYATVASLYLWAIAAGACNLKDCATPTGTQKKKPKNKQQ
ncbi:MAG: DNA-3-methyladenine glycosylase 2 family protein [Tannerella sp.]|jgi:DNA-3-methyladenine glycosylase II|nr:DNA-3-methyladenine glycosylase 2 family protein [Tannerella sp.]